MMEVSQEVLLEHAKNATIKLNSTEVEKLKKMLIDYCEIYYRNLEIFLPGNRQHLDKALEWAIIRKEQLLNPRVSSTGNLVIGDGTWLANTNNYYQALVQSKPDIGDYLKEFCKINLTNNQTMQNDISSKRR